MTRNLVEHQITDEQAARIEHEMRAAFEEAEVDQAEFTRLEPAMTNDEKDRHVLAAAVAADAELIVTFDTADFPPQACEPLGVEATHPDDVFDLHDLKPESRARTAGRRPRPALATRRAPLRTDDRRRSPLRLRDPCAETRALSFGTRTYRPSRTSTA
jgi:hypothetical protein